MADYAVELIPHLARLGPIAVRRPPGWKPGVEEWADGVSFVAADAPTPAGHVPLYHVGNNPYHVWIVRQLRREGGIVVLHDTVVHHLLVEEAAADGDWERFSNELETAEPGAGEKLAAARAWGFGGRLDPFIFPARSAYLRLARGAIVHSEHARAEVAAACPGLPVRHVPLAVAGLPAGDRDAWRQRLGAGPGELVLVHLGFLTPSKGMGTIVRALAALEELRVQFKLVVVGEGSEASEFKAAVRAADLSSRVVEWGYAEPEDLGGIVGAADLGLVPRYPTAGETSAAALRFLAAGTPVIVAGYEQFLELPAEAALRILPGRAGLVDLLRHVCRLAADGEARSSARAAARSAWESGGHAPAHAAVALRRALEEIAGELAH